MIKVAMKIVTSLLVLYIMCTSENPAIPHILPQTPCVLPVTVIGGIGTSALTIGMSKNTADMIMELFSVETLNNRFYYCYHDSCDDTYKVEYSDINTVSSIEIISRRIKCASNIVAGSAKEDIEAQYGPAFVTSVYQTLNALHYDIEGLIFFVDDSDGLKSIKVLAPRELLSVKSGYGSDEINIHSTRSSIESLDYDSLSFTQKSTCEYATLIYNNRVYGIWFLNDTTVSRIAFGSNSVCDSIITKRNTKDSVRSIYGIPDTQMRLESLNQDVYCYIHRGVDFIFDTCGYVTQTVIYPPQ